MKIYIALGQQKCLDVTDLNTIACQTYLERQDNPKYLQDEINKVKTDYDKIIIIGYEIPDKEILSLLYPIEKTLKGKVVSKEDI
jgi:hypothetical protein